LAGAQQRSLGMRIIEAGSRAGYIFWYLSFILTAAADESAASDTQIYRPLLFSSFVTYSPFRPSRILSPISSVTSIQRLLEPTPSLPSSDHSPPLAARTHHDPFPLCLLPFLLRQDSEVVGRPRTPLAEACRQDVHCRSPVGTHPCHLSGSYQTSLYHHEWESSVGMILATMFHSFRRVRLGGRPDRDSDVVPQTRRHGRILAKGQG
jgi:hypothetical protein